MKPINSLKEQLQEILAGREYQIYHRENQDILGSLLNRLKNWLYPIVKNYVPQHEAAEKTSEWLSYGITVVGVLLFLLLIVLLLSRFSRQVQLYPERMNISKKQALTLQQRLVEAQRLAEQGEYSSALRHLFLGFIMYLDQNRWIEAKAWKTNWEYFSELKNHAPHLADAFTGLAVKFEEAMYGGRPISADDYWLFHNQVSGWIHKGEAN